MNILITGGMGYIGSHTALSLLDAGHRVIILDNLSNSSIEVLDRLRQLSQQEIIFYQSDIRDREQLQKIFSQHEIDIVMHFAGLKAVGESVEHPIKYYDNNVSGSLILIEEMAKAGIYKIVFSSSATVYGDPASVPIYENMPTGNTTNPYGTSKHMVERILQDLQASNPQWVVILLRYFNPVGAHHSGLLGENPQGIPNNLLPYICQVASGKLSQLTVFGNDYPTIDGTGVRDYIHVVDLADGHLKAMEKHSDQGGLYIYNLGTGRGYSVLEIIQAFESINKISIPYSIKGRRSGDIAICFANSEKAQKALNWQAKHDLSAMMRDAWFWQSKNPEGYQ